MLKLVARFIVHVVVPAAFLLGSAWLALVLIGA